MNLYDILKTSKLGAGAAPDMYTALMASKMSAENLTEWQKVRAAVRKGTAPELYPVGTILYDDWGNENSTAYEVVAYDKHFDPSLTTKGCTHSMTLCALKLDDVIQFDAPEAWLYVETELPAGVYRFKIPDYDTSYGGNKWYYFTTAKAVPVGGQITLTWSYNANPTRVATYATVGAVSALESLTIAEWIDSTSPAAVDLGVIKLAMSDAESTYGKLNHIHRTRYGSNNYLQSGIRQYLNADSTAGWWKPQTVFDRPPSNYTSAGKLTRLNSDFLNVLAMPAIESVANNLFEYPSLDGTTFILNTAYDIAGDKLFLLSHTEINLLAAPNVGTVLDYYFDVENDKRIKVRKSNNSAYYWWLRAPFPSTASYVRGVSTSGAVSILSAYTSYGSAEACIIQ